MLHINMLSSTHQKQLDHPTQLFSPFCCFFLLQASASPFRVNLFINLCVISFPSFLQWFHLLNLNSIYIGNIICIDLMAPVTTHIM